MDALCNQIFILKSWVWSAPLLILILGTGIYYTIILRGLQFRYLGYGLRQMFNRSDSDAAGDISHFESLMTSLAGAIGTGSITGVATGVAIGGLGALFWMWVTALTGMAIRYAEALLAVKYRVVDKKGEMVGGPMEYICHGLGWRWTAVSFAVFGIAATVGTGNLVQVNSIGDALSTQWAINPWITGLILATLTGLVLIGGVKSIGHVAGILVPAMAVFYVGGGILILINNYSVVPAAFMLIVKSAFTGQAATGGFVGASVMLAVQFGVARSIFSSEAGLGISAIAAAAAKTDHPGRQAMVAMTGVFLSTMVVCSITGLVMAVTGVLGASDPNGATLSGAPMAIEAFNRGFPGSGMVVTIGLVLFAYSTVVAWAYYGEKCCEFLFGERSILWYRILFTLMIIPGAALDMNFVWGVADVANGLMCFPNLIALIGLSGIVVKETKDYLKIAEMERKGEG